MLPSSNRLRSTREFRDTLSQGRRCTARTLITYWHRMGPDGPSQVGLVVGRRVGRAVTRNRVKRRLRHLLRARTGSLPPGSRLVVRALPAAAAATSAELGLDLGSCLDRMGRFT